MISVLPKESFIEVKINGKQLITPIKLKTIYRLGLKIKKDRGNCPVLVLAGKNVTLNDEAQNMFNRIERIENDNTMVVISI